MAAWQLRLGAAMIVFSPSIAVLMLLLARRAQLMILTILAAFFWLVAALVAALFWRILPDDTAVLMAAVGVIVQEMGRFALVSVYRRTEKIIIAVSASEESITSSPPFLGVAMRFPLNDWSSSLAAGVGFGTMHALIVFGSVLAASEGPATLYEGSCCGVPMLLLYAVLALAFVMLDVMLMCIVFHAERRGDRLMQCFVVGSHLAASFATLFNQVEEGCTISLPLLVLVVLVTVLALNRYGATMH
jgi:hypothetical protein